MKINDTPITFFSNLVDAAVVGIVSYLFFLYIYPLDWILPEFAALTLAGIVFVVKEGPDIEEASKYISETFVPKVSVISRRGNPLGAVKVGFYDLYDGLKRRATPARRKQEQGERVESKLSKFGFALPAALYLFEKFQKSKIVGVATDKRVWAKIAKTIKETAQKPIPEQNRRILNKAYSEPIVRNIVENIVVIQDTVEKLKSDLSIKKREAVDRASQAAKYDLISEIDERLPDEPEMDEKLNGFLRKGKLAEAQAYLIENITWLENIVARVQRIDEKGDYPAGFLATQREEVQEVRPRFRKFYEAIKAIRNS
jgi:hypothetical protein